MKRSVLFWICIVLFSAVALFSGYQIILELSEYSKGESAYNELSQYVHFETVPNQQDPTQATQQQTATQEETPAVPVVDFEKLRAINPDITGWIYVAGTNISYPIVQSEDNDYYLYRLFDGTVNSAGSIFMDCGADSDWQGRNTVIYGHNMKNKSMFAHVVEYKSQSFYDAHPTGLLLTPDGNWEIRFFSGYVADPTEPGEDTWQQIFPSDEDFLEWMGRAARRSTFVSGVVPSVQDRVITLSTCSYEFDDARYVLLGVLRPTEE